MKSDATGLTFEMEMKDTRCMKHAVVKRPFNGKKRQEAIQNLKTEGCAKFQKVEARKLMGPGDIEPPILPSLNVLHEAKKNGIDEDLGINKNDARDIAKSIEDMALSPRYSGTIQEVRGFPFRVTYGSATQFHVWKEYGRITQNRPTVCIDATGGLVTKLQRSNGSKSGYIFLYAIVINFDEITACVYQMLSERHTVGNIMAMLKEWMENGARVPKEVACDYSRALLMAICLIFNNQTTTNYVNDRYEAVSKGISKRELTTFVRIDGAHFTQIVCRFPCFKNLRQLVIRDFFIRCVSLMVEAVKFVDFQQIWLLTCVVALHTHEDSMIALGNPNTPNSARKQLEEWIATRKISKNDDVLETISNRNTPFDLKFTRFEDNDEPEIDVASQSDITKWTEAQIRKASEVSQIGENLNAFYLPDFIERFTPLVKEFPLWSSVGMPPNTKRATSNYVEGYFNDLKQRTVKNYKLPISVNKFLREHIKDIEETNCLVSGRIVQYNNELLHKNNDTSEMSPEEAHDPDFMQIENWRNKGKAPNFERKPVESKHEEADVQITTTLASKEEIFLGRRTDDEYNAIIDEPDVGLKIFEERIDDGASAGEEIAFQQRSDHTYSKGSKSLAIETSLKDKTFDISGSCIGASSTPIKDTTIAQDMKPLTSTKFFKPYPDVQHENALFIETHMRRKKINLLPNGSLCPPVLVHSIPRFKFWRQLEPITLNISTS